MQRGGVGKRGIIKAGAFNIKLFMGSNMGMCGKVSVYVCGWGGGNGRACMFTLVKSSSDDTCTAYSHS